MRPRGGAVLPLGGCGLPHVAVFCGGVPPGSRRQVLRGAVLVTIHRVWSCADGTCEAHIKCVLPTSDAVPTCPDGGGRVSLSVRSELLLRSSALLLNPRDSGHSARVRARPFPKGVRVGLAFVAGNQMGLIGCRRAQLSVARHTRTRAQTCPNGPKRV